MVGQEDVSVVNIVDQVIHKALELNASDIHLEPLERELRIRFRIDGMLQDGAVAHNSIKKQIISRLKVLAHMDITEHRIPQDGKFILKTSDGAAIDMRISTFPSLHGEKMVIRILDKNQMKISLEDLGFSYNMLEQFKQLLSRPQGFFLVTGPTGSGKTTTLYAALSLLNSPQKNIITLEDPVEYNIEGITQGHINRATGFTFAQGIRSLLRQDPDIIMIGEIRDPESARIAIEAAMTGHLVLSTLHTNDAPSAIIRLMDMGIEPFLINAAVTGVLAQRLTRKICNQCKHLGELSLEEKKFLEKHFNGESERVTHAYRGEGCQACLGTGFRKRTGIFELLVMNDTLSSFINQYPKLETIRVQAQTDGMRSLAYDGFEKIQNGDVCVEELMRVLA
ncbi:hypothetical protein A3F06_03320 [candidate division TM6 bacterium RIFCSPHIGHO2_12_FULL_36_22]|nr:MAG: hypothetical protein A3F06_03320 [candidate division TM6 bacterium RIFCSPHIGHO2_12_FULL_36_22]